MAFNKNNLRRQESMGSIGNGANSVRFLNTYLTDDTPATVEGASYFNAAWQELAPGDIIIASMGIGGTLKAKIYQVTASTVSGVTVALLTTAAG